VRRVNTKPSEDIQNIINEAHALFFKNFSCRFLSDKSGIPYTSVCSQKTRSKISGEAASEYCKIKEVKKIGFTKEMLRPDIQDWGDLK